MFITVIATIIRISSPVIDVNLSQPTHEKLKERKKELEERNTVGPSIRPVSYTHLTLPTNREV